ncbi:MAG TPA: hypothetical protein VM715_17850, partial [Candidatus Acidoferrum sp.]|nr:hypothetical protein [Candidatus Acidoferrum sp.]
NGRYTFGPIDWGVLPYPTEHPDEPAEILDYAVQRYRLNRQRQFCQQHAGRQVCRISVRLSDGHALSGGVERHL